LPIVLEKQVERYLVKKVEAVGGKAYKFTSPGRGGVADRIVCLPDGSTWFVELKTAGGKMSALQLIFAEDMRRMKQNYTVLWSKEDVDAYLNSL
jgi:hypothetical protein